MKEDMSYEPRPVLHLGMFSLEAHLLVFLCLFKALTNQKRARAASGC